MNDRSEKKTTVHFRTQNGTGSERPRPKMIRLEWGKLWVLKWTAGVLFWIEWPVRPVISELGSTTVHVVHLYRLVRCFVMTEPAPTLVGSSLVRIRTIRPPSFFHSVSEHLILHLLSVEHTTPPLFIDFLSINLRLEYIYFHCIVCVYCLYTYLSSSNKGT